MTQFSGLVDDIDPNGFPSMVGDAVVESETQSEEASENTASADKPETASSNNEEDRGEGSSSDDNGSSTAPRIRFI